LLFKLKSWRHPKWPIWIGKVFLAKMYSNLHCDYAALLATLANTTQIGWQKLMVENPKVVLAKN